MGDAQTVISLVVAGVLGGIGLWWSRRELRKAGVGATRAEAIKNLQIVADTWEERYRLEVDARVSVESKLTKAEAERDALARIVERRRNARSDA